MTIIKFHIENEVYVLFKSRLISIQGSRLERAITSNSYVDPRILVNCVPNDKFTVIEAYLDTTIDCWHKILNVINNTNCDNVDSEVLYFTDTNSLSSNSTDESKYVEIDSSILERLKLEDDQSDDYEGYNMEELLKIINANRQNLMLNNDMDEYGDVEPEYTHRAQLIEDDSNSEGSNRDQHKDTDTDIDSLINKFKDTLNNDGLVSLDVMQEMSTNKELNNYLKTQLNELDVDSPVDESAYLDVV